jgi:hypothetical protein
VTIFGLVLSVALLGLLVFSGVMLVLYGTSVRNRWGINRGEPSKARLGGRGHYPPLCWSTV